MVIRAAISCLAISASAQPALAAALPVSPVERALAFATCAGRYSALVEHLYLFDGAAAEARASERDAFVDLLDAVLPFALDDGLPADRPMALRVGAKAVQTALLSRATFGSDPVVAETARQMAEQRLADCGTLMLGA